MKSQEIREQFRKFFVQKGHAPIASSSLVPHNDPTLLFNNAGMNQFKDNFTGRANPQDKRAVTIQKCVRAGGKHNDLDNVGFTARHHTFFEMLGNFSFGDYFKREAISYAWELLTKVYMIPRDKLFITVHYTDDEAVGIWKNDIGIPTDRIFKKDKDNFWEMGEYGPCGPCSEIFFDHGPKFAKKNFVMSPQGDLLDDDERYVEIWNLVFMQFEKNPQGTLSLPKPSIDTGAGLERITAALQGKNWNYDTDLFTPIIERIEKMSGHSYQDPKWNSSMRVVADHIRSSTMLITDGVMPAAEGRGYVLRRIIRRAVRHLKDLGLKDAAFYKLVPEVFQILGHEFPLNAQNAELAQKTLKGEEEKFMETLDQGLKFLGEHLERLPQSQANFPGELAFKLYDTYGFPPDLTEIILKEKGKSFDQAAFDQCMNEQKEKSKKSWKGADLFEDKTQFFQLKEKFGTTEFKGYTEKKLTSKLLWAGDEKTSGSTQDQLLLFTQTPFYGESGGQAGDRGVIKKQGQVVAEIQDTFIPVEGLIIHHAKVMPQQKLNANENYELEINTDNRQMTANNHTATHLLQAALIKVLGSHIKQAGSLVSAEKLRFDFTHSAALTEEQKHTVEDIVNTEIRKQTAVAPQLMTKDQAIKKGATALFNEKYGDHVRVIEVPGFSMELCGGTHVENTKDILFFKILSDESLSSGVRRVEAITGETAINYLRKRSSILEKVEASLSLKEEKVLLGIEQLRKNISEAQKEKDGLAQKILQFEGESLLGQKTQIRDFEFYTVAIDADKDIKKLSDILIDKVQTVPALILIQQKQNEKISVLLRSSKPLIQIDCSALLKALFQQAQGRGGGKKDLAQGSVPSEFGEAAVISFLKTQLQK